jgi:hypothetical protein
VATPNYSFAKRQKELAKKSKKEDKLKRKAADKADGGSDGESDGDGEVETSTGEQGDSLPVTPPS